MQPVVTLLVVTLLSLFGLVLWTSPDHVGRFARRPVGRDPRLVPRLLAGVAALLALALVVGWLVLS